MSSILKDPLAVAVIKLAALPSVVGIIVGFVLLTEQVKKRLRRWRQK